MKYSPTPANKTEACCRGIVGIFGRRGSSSRTTTDRTRRGATLASATYCLLTLFAVSIRCTFVRAGRALTMIRFGADRAVFLKTKTLDPPVRSLTGTRSCDRAGRANVKTNKHTSTRFFIINLVRESNFRVKPAAEDGGAQLSHFTGSRYH